MATMENGWEIVRDALMKADLDPDDMDGRINPKYCYSAGYSESSSSYGTSVYLDHPDQVPTFWVGLCETLQEVDGCLDQAWELARNHIVDSMGKYGCVIVFRSLDLGPDPSRCELCEERIDDEKDEAGEFISEGGTSMRAHAQCGLDRELELA